MNPIEEYVKAVISQVHFFWDRTLIAAELRHHLEDSVEMLIIEEGLSEAEAQKEAAARMGDAKTVGQQLNQVHHPVWGWLWLISGSLAAVAGIVLMGFLINQGWLTIQGEFPVSPANAEKLADLNEHVEMAGHSVIFDALWKAENNDWIVTYRVHNKIMYSCSGWSITLFQLLDESSKILASPYAISSAILNSRGLIQFDAADTETVILSFVDGQQISLNLSRWEAEE